MKMFKFNLVLFTIIVAILSLTDCQKEQDLSRDFPRIRTLEVSDIDGTGALFNGEIIYIGNFDITEYGFVWTSDPTMIYLDSSKLPVSGTAVVGKFGQRINSTLETGKVYLIRAYIKANGIMVYGQLKTFTGK
jgi:hypothetical protein